VHCFINEKTKAEFVIATFADSTWKSSLADSAREVNVNIQEQFIQEQEFEVEQEFVVEQDYLPPSEDEQVYESDPEPSAVSSDSLFKRLREI
jgi:hypothetical protein